MKTIGITGVSGFIAGHTAEEALRRGYNVVGLDHQLKSPEHYPDGVEVFLGDMRDETAMTEFAAHVDGVIHLAGVLGTQETIKNPRPAVESNIKGGLNFLEACSQYKLPGVNICVGNWDMDNPYSISKNTVERMSNMFNHDRDGKINQVRAVNAYGPRQVAAAPFGTGKVRKITPAFVCRALTNMPIEVYGDGEQVSDMVYVGDVAYALVNALEKADQGVVLDRVVEVGPAKSRTVNQVAEMVMRVTGNNVGITHLPMRPGETPGAHVTADTSTLQLIGMDLRNMTGLEAGMNKTVDYFRNERGKSWDAPK